MAGRKAGRQRDKQKGWWVDLLLNFAMYDGVLKLSLISPSPHVQPVQTPMHAKHNPTIRDTGRQL
jgi:hypothetical protein